MKESEQANFEEEKRVLEGIEIGLKNLTVKIDSIGIIVCSNFPI